MALNGHKGHKGPTLSDIPLLETLLTDAMPATKSKNALELACVGSGHPARLCLARRASGCDAEDLIIVTARI